MMGWEEGTCLKSGEGGDWLEPCLDLQQELT